MSKPEAITPTLQARIPAASLGLYRESFLLEEHKVTLAQRVRAWDQDYPGFLLALLGLEPHFASG